MAKDSTSSACKVSPTVERGAYKVLPHQLFHKSKQLYPPIHFTARTWDISDTMEMVEMTIRQHSGDSNWEREAKRNLELMRTVVWNGATSITLSCHAQIHRNCYANIVEATNHCEFTRPSKQTRVEKFTSSIKCKDNNVNARLANIDADQTPSGLKNNFEPAAAYLLEVYPVEASQSTKRAIRFDTSANVSSAFIGNCGPSEVDYQWHTPE